MFQFLNSVHTLDGVLVQSQRLDLVPGVEGALVDLSDLIFTQVEFPQLLEFFKMLYFHDFVICCREIP